MDINALEEGIKKLRSDGRNHDIGSAKNMGFNEWIKYTKNSFQEYLDNPKITEQLLASNTFKEEMETQAKYVSMIKKYEASGRREFVICDDLFEMILETEPEEIKLMDVCLPFDSFSIVFNNKILKKHAIKYGDGEDVSCADRLVVCGTSIKNEKDKIFYMTGFGFSNHKEFGLVPFSIASSMETKINKHIMFTNEKNITEKIKDIFRKKDTNQHDSSYNLFLRIVFNLLSYINCVDADISDYSDEIKNLTEQSKKMERWSRARKVIQQKIHQMRIDNGRIVIVGKNTKSTIRDKYQEPSRTITKRFIVRGHFRRQACGPNRELRVTTWIKPHWKGPEFAEKINKKYLVKMSKEEVLNAVEEVE